MKVLQINTSDRGGGAEKVGYQITKELNNRDIQADLMVGWKHTADDNIFQIKKTLTDKIISKVMTNILALQGVGYFQSKKCCEFIKEKNYNIVHYHNIHGEYFSISNISKISKLLPSVWTLHDMWSFTGRCAYSFDCDGWLSECGQCGVKLNKTYPEMPFDNSASVLKDKKKAFLGNKINFVAPSKWLENLMRKSFLKNENIRTIYNGVDLEVFKFHDKNELRDKYGLEADKRYILFAAANMNDNRKGFKYLINALNNLPDKKDIVLITVGSPINKNLVSKEFQIKEYGYISEESKMNEIYALADIFVMPSLMDNFPCTVLESMASGTPVIAFNVGGIGEQIAQDSGWLVPVKDDIELSKELQHILKNSELLKEYGYNARKRIKENFTLDICVNSYIALYSSILGKSS
ncbi:glycosyltransferase family 4 protein [Clostridium pasteurianum]|uniref:glycosyltransferase family 4 protein n=1 Tax=Clostridium pasteurianum TaxID=1501 RepID=UPI002260C9DD|nr:glycosyltransferase family 4 protein [Clostridium pasteurianum]UZW14941.1 glycosyltransferase family 4 protein [Clostridium pasteurianum]